MSVSLKMFECLFFIEIFSDFRHLRRNWSPFYSRQNGLYYRLFIVNLCQRHEKLTETASGSRQTLMTVWRFYVFIDQAKDNWKMCKVLKHTERTLVLRLCSIHFEINGNPCNLIGSHWYDLFTNLIFSCIFYPTSKEALLKYNNEQISRKWKTTFVTFSKPAHYWINKTFVQPKESWLWETQFAISKWM